MIDEKVAGNQWNVLLNRIDVNLNTIISKSIESRMNEVNMQMIQVALFPIVHVISIIKSVDNMCIINKDTNVKYYEIQLLCMTHPF